MTIVGYTQENLDKLFECFDTDKNGLVDALELLITLALASGKCIVRMSFIAFLSLLTRLRRNGYHRQTHVCILSLRL